MNIELLQETNEKKKLKKLLTNDERCDNLLELSLERQQKRTLITEQ